MSGDGDLEYVAQLRSVFDSCDTTATGTINRKELLQLCEKLEFESQAQNLADKLMGDDPDCRVDFEHFKDAFIAVLTEGLGSSDEEDGGTEDESTRTEYNMAEAPPTRKELVLRLSSLEEVDEDEQSCSGDSQRTKPLTASGPKMSQKISSKVSPQVSTRASPRMSPTVTPTMTPKTTPTMTPLMSPASSPSTPPRRCRKTSETFEAEGQMEPPTAEGDTAIEENRRHIHLVWQELGVGKNGFLTMEELASVCQKIGMEQMNDEELQHLFDKLDVDCDGRVSFDEFLHGLFQYGGPSAAHSPSRQLSATPRQKLRKALSSHIEENQQTASLITSGSGLFSALDVDNTGFADPDDIIALWDSFGIQQGAEILEYLQFSLTSKINLLDLSYALEQEMRSVEEDNATYQAAIASYEYELRFLKHQTEHLVAERNKLKADLAEVNNRITILVKEGDERYSLLEKSKEKEREELEKKYQEQIRALQSELDKERETFYHQSSTEAQKLASTLNVLKEEESKLKDRVASVQKDYERLEKENRDMAERYADLEAKKERLQKDLEATAELQHRLEEIESSQDVFLDEHQKFSEQKLRQLESENKELKDKADELTVEIEELRQQLLAHKRRFGYPTEPEDDGSRLMDYDKLFRADNYSPQGTGDEASEDDVDIIKVRRRLPRRPSDVQSEDGNGATLVTLLTEKLQDEVNQLTTEKESLLLQHQEEIRSLKKQYEERIVSLMENNEEQLKSREHWLEEKLDALRKEHDIIVQSIRKDHQEIIKSLESHYQLKLNEQEQLCEVKCEQLRSEADKKLKLVQKEHCLELTLLQAKHEETLDRIREEYESKIRELENKRDDERNGISEYQERIKAMEKKHAEELERLREEYQRKISEIESVHAENLEQMKKESKDQIKELEKKHEELVDSLQVEHDEEVRGLHQKLEGLSSESNIRTEEVVALQRGFSIERKDIEDAYKMEIAEMEDKHMQEMNELLKKTKAEKETIRAEFDAKLNEKIKEVENRIKQEIEHEKQEILIKAESQKNLLRVEFEKEKERIIAEHQLELAKKDVEIEKLEDKVKLLSDELEKLKVAYELQMKLQKEELELEFKKEKINMLETFEQEKAKLLEKHRNDIYDYENIFAKGTEGLRGQLKTEFFNLLEQHKHREEEKLRAKMKDELQREKQQLLEELKSEQTAQLEELRREKELLEREQEALLQSKNMEQKYQQEEAQRERSRIIDELTKEKEQLEREWRADKDRLNEDHQRELLSKQKLIDDLEHKVAALEQELGEAVNEKRALELERSSQQQEHEMLWKKMQESREQEIQKDLEEEFSQQMDELKKAFLEERSQLEHQVKQLQHELEEASQSGSEMERKLLAAEKDICLLKEKKSWLEKQIADQNLVIVELKEEKRGLDEEKQALNKELQEKLVELSVAREQAAAAAQVQALQAAARPNADTEKNDILKKIDSQKQLLLERTNELEKQIERLQRSKDQNIPLQLENERLLEENKALEKALHDASQRLRDTEELSLSADHYRTKINNIEAERDALRQQLQMTTDRLTEANTSLSLLKSEHQRELGALRQQISNMMDLDKHKQLKKQLADAQNKIGQLEAALEKRAAETTKVIMGTQADYKRNTERLEEEKEAAEQKAEKLQQLLDEQVEKLKQQLEVSAKTDLLVKELYVENSELMKSLYLTEKREKDAQKKASNLEDACKDYMRLIQKLVPLAME